MKKITNFVFIALCICTTINAQKTQTSQLEALQKKMSSIPNNATSSLSTDNCGDYTNSPAAVIDDAHDPVDVITVAAHGIINDLNVVIDISHTFTGDLEITLTSPAGTVVNLFFDKCSSNNDINIMFDDEGVALVCAQPTVGTFIPDNPLSAFDGETFEGDWTLTVVDNVSFDDGVLNTWCLVPTLSCGEPSEGTITNITAVVAYLGWTVGPDTESMWDVEWGAVGFLPGTGTELGMAADTPHNPFIVTGLTSETTFEFYVRAVCNANDSSDWAGPYAFTTLTLPIVNCGDHTSSPAAVIDNFSDPVDVITVAANAGIINDLNVVIDIAHTWVSDLEITLTSPAGTVVDLFFDKCNSSNDINIMFDDEGVALVCAQPTIGTFIPDNPLSAFDGEAFEGDWTLTVVDDSIGDGGVLNTWCLVPSLTFPCGEPSEGTVTNITSVTADLGWTVGPDAESMWDVEWGAVGFSPGTATELGMVEDNPFTATGLTSATTFEFYVRAVCNTNDSSDWAGPYTFTTVTLSTDDCGDHTSSPAAVIDNESPPVVDVITVPAGAENIADLNVLVYISHTFTADLEITLTSPAGTVVDLFFDRCFDRNDINIMFDDEGIALICAQSTVGTFIPDNPLSAFDGEAFEGDWTLTVVDDAAGDNGVLNTWCLISGTTASIADNIIEGFEFYPNPANDVINLKALNTIDSVALFNALGQKVITQTINETTSQLDISRLSAGFYIMKVTSNNQTASYQIIKK